MINQVKICYSHCDNLGCHKRMNTSFFVRDNAPDMCVIINDKSAATCFIENTSDKVIDFICVDSCLINTNQIKKCDFCMISENIIWFVELKEVLFSGNAKADIKRKKRNANDAVKQLASTINDFKLKGFDFSNLSVFSLIAFPPYVDETNPITIPSTSSQSRVLKYSNLCGFVDLFEGNHLVF